MASWTQEIGIFVHKTCNSLSTEAYDFVAIKNRIKSNKKIILEIVQGHKDEGFFWKIFNTD